MHLYQLYEPDMEGNTCNIADAKLFVRHFEDAMKVSDKCSRNIKQVDQIKHIDKENFYLCRSATSVGDERIPCVRYVVMSGSVVFGMESRCIDLKNNFYNFNYRHIKKSFMKYVQGSCSINPDGHVCT